MAAAGRPRISRLRVLLWICLYTRRPRVADLTAAPVLSANTHVMKPTKAYNNRRFLMSEEARAIRILAEYLEPKARLEAAGISRAVAFFGSARIVPNPKAQYDFITRARRQLAEALARWTVQRHPVNKRYHLVSGGGPGIMRAVHEGAARVDRRLNVGLNISLPHEQNVNPYVLPTQAFEFHYFFMRKFWFMNHRAGSRRLSGGSGRWT